MRCIPSGSTVSRTHSISSTKSIANWIANDSCSSLLQQNSASTPSIDFITAGGLFSSNSPSHQNKPTKPYAIFNNVKSKSAIQAASRNYRTCSLESVASSTSNSSSFPENITVHNAILDNARSITLSTESIESAIPSLNPLSHKQITTDSQRISRIPRFRACRNATNNYRSIASPSSRASSDPFDTDGSSDKEFLLSEAEEFGPVDR